MKKTSLFSVLLFCSLLANAFLLGFLISRCPMNNQPHKRFDKMERAVHHIDPAYRGQVEKLMAANRQKMDARIDVMGRNFDRITAILTAPEFEEKKLKAVHQDIEKSDKGMKDGMFTMMVGIAKILPDDERIKFFRESAPDHPSGPPPRDRNHGPDGVPPPNPDN